MQYIQSVATYVTLAVLTWKLLAFPAEKGKSLPAAPPKFLERPPNFSQASRVHHNNAIEDSLSPFPTMAFSKGAPAMNVKPKNKLRRQSAHLATKKAKESEKRDERFRRKREEDKNPALREARQAKNVPATIDAKRTWDEGVGDEEDALGWAVDVERLAKKRKLAQEAAERAVEEEGVLAQLKKRDGEDEDVDVEEADEEEDEEMDSMLDSDSEAGDSDDSDAPRKSKRKPDPPNRATSPTTSTATNLELSPEFLKQKFPALFEPAPEPKILITTSLNSTLFAEAQILTDFFPNSTFSKWLMSLRSELKNFYGPTGNTLGCARRNSIEHKY